jgi:hypothetical protein
MTAQKPQSLSFFEGNVVEVTEKDGDLWFPLEDLAATQAREDFAEAVLSRIRLGPTEQVIIESLRHEVQR